MEPDLLPYRASLPTARCVLVLAPHPDDEVFGCGGTLVQMRAAGAKVVEIILTSGDRAGDATVRESESCEASHVLGLSTPQFWRLPDREVAVTPLLLTKLSDSFSEHDVDLVLAPSPWEVHPDHRATCQLAVEAVNKAAKPVRLGFYEVGVPLRPNCLCDITAWVPTKRQAMHCFASQMALQDYGEQVLALNRYRSYTLGLGVTHAEAFWFPALNQWRDLNARLTMDWVSPGNVANDAHASAAPLTDALVTVVVWSAGESPWGGRTLDLERLFDAISLQTYRQIQVLVIGDATYPDGGWMGCPVRHVVPEELDAMQSAFVLFARAGDWLLPDHIAKLVDALVRLPQAHTARSVTSCRGKSVDVSASDTERVPCASVLWRVADVCEPKRWLQFQQDRVGGFDLNWLNALGPTAAVDGVSAWSGNVNMDPLPSRKSGIPNLWGVFKRFWRAD